MKHIDTLINAKWIFPIAPKNIVLENYSIAVDQGLIVDLAPIEHTKKTYVAKENLDFPEHVLMPGLVNAHTHTPMTLFRGLADDLNLMDWLQNHIWPAEKALINEESVSAGTYLAVAEMIRSGVTCFNDHYFFHNQAIRVAMDANIRACVGLWIGNVSTQWARNEDEYFSKAISTLEKPSSSLISLALAPHAPYTVTDPSLKRIKELSDYYQIPIHMHVQETQVEVDQHIKQYGQRPLQRLEKLSLLSRRFIAVHMVALNQDDIKLVNNTETHVVHCPEANLKLASGIAPLAALLDANINVALGTDGTASNNDLDMFGEMRTAALLAKGSTANPMCLPAQKVLEMATLSGARALGLAHKIGSLEPGKAADLIAIGLDDFFTQPVYNPMSQIVYAANRLQVSDVWVEGKQLLRNGQFSNLNIEKILENVKPWAKAAMGFKA